MRLQQDRLQTIKNYLHIIQLGLVFLAIILTIAVYTRNGASDGRTAWYFALCWLTIPLLIYLVMVPMWSRTQRFGNVYAFAALDGLFTILWLSAWAAVAAYVSAGGGCSHFSLGSNGKCKLSEGTVVLGVFIMALFIGTSYVSIRTAMHYRRTGMMPTKKTNAFEIQTEDAFSSNMQKDDIEEDAESRRGSYPSFDQAQPPSVFDPTSFGQSEQYSPLQHRNDHEELGQPHLAGLGFRYNSPSVEDYDTSYAGGYGDRRFS
jgi:translocation protein SEC72